MTTVSDKIDAKLVKELRDKSGAPMGDCLKALQEVKGDIEEAFVVLRKRGMASAQKKAARSTNEGTIGTYIHAGGKIGVLVEVNSETDFVARNPKFLDLSRDIAMHIAAMSPQYLDRESVPADVVAKVRDEFKAAVPAGKPPEVAEKIVEGKLNKWYEEHVLLDQPFVKDDSLSVNDLINAAVGSLGEKIKVRRFTKYALGEN
jgi:elongation factor Ts